MKKHKKIINAKKLKNDIIKIKITINEEAKEAVKTRVIYTWRDKEGKIRYSKDPKYTFKKITEVKYGNLGYDD